MLATPFESSAIRKLKTSIFGILRANCVPDSEDTQFGKTANLTCGRSPHLPNLIRNENVNVPTVWHHREYREREQLNLEPLELLP